MKRISLLVTLCASLVITSCTNPADTARLGALADVAIGYAASKGQISPGDAVALRQAKTIILPSSTAAPPSDKQPVANLQP